ncbi:MAG: hypothetical protein RL701_11, partial [Pseudomonadota bacterium]
MTTRAAHTSVRSSVSVAIPSIRRRAKALSLVCCLVSGCGTTQPPRPTPLPQPAASEAREGLSAELSGLNTRARAGAVTEIIGGERVDDPYRALEQTTPDTEAWLAAQTARTEQALAKLRDPEAEARLKRLLEIGTLGEVEIAGKRVFFTLREAPRERPALYMLDTTAPIPAASELRAATPLIDPQTFGARAALDYMVPARAGRYVAFGISDNGDERATLRVYDVEQKRLLPDEIAHAKWSAVEWLNDDSGFYYRRYPKPGEARWNESEPDSYDAQLFVHRLGQPVDSDVLVFKGDKPVDFPAATLDDTGRYLLITNQRTWTASDVWLWDRGATASKRGFVPPADKLVPILRDTDKLANGVIVGGQLYLTTNLDAPKQRIIKVDAAHAADRAHWKVIVPESDATIESALVTQHFIVVHSIRHVQSRLELYDHEGAALGELVLPDIGSVAELSGAIEHDRIVFTWSSFLNAPQLFACDLTTRKLENLYQVEQDFRAQDYELKQVSVPSTDGTAINVFYTQKRGIVRDGKTPVLVYGYGGFDVSLLPSFSRSALYFLEQGGIYAQANLRGGGEFGESWHRAGMLK